MLEAARHWPIAFDSDFYRVLYCLLLLPVRVLACVVAWKQSRRMVLATLPFAAMLLYLSIRGVSSAPSVDQWICLIDGVVVTSAGLGLAFTAAFSEHRSVYATLTILWMLLGLFDFGYVLQPYGKWAALNDSLLPVMVIGAFGWIAFKQNIQRETRERKAGYYA